MVRYALSLALCWLVLVSGAAAQDALRIGYVDMKQVLDNAPQVLASREQLEREFRPRNDDVLAEEQRLADMEQRLGSASVGQQVELEREIRNLRRTIQRRKEDLRDELAFRRNEEIQRLEDELSIAVQSIAQEQGFDLVFASPVVYANPELDITEVILRRLEEEFRTDQVESSSLTAGNEP